MADKRPEAFQPPGVLAEQFIADFPFKALDFLVFKRGTAAESSWGVASQVSADFL